MEEVLRQLYGSHHRDLQRRRIEKALQEENYVTPARPKYDFREDHALHALATLAAPDLALELRFDKELELNQRLAQALKDRQSLPLLTKRTARMRRKLRVAVWAVVFLARVGKRVQEGLLRRKRRTERCCKTLLASIQRLVRGYYEPLLEQELRSYFLILEQVQQGIVDQQKEVLQMLHYMAERLATSTVTRDFLEFLVLTATDRSFPPADYLTAPEIARLDFSEKFGCTWEVSLEQTRMLVGMGLGVKVFCFYVLYQPWRLALAPASLRDPTPAVKAAAAEVGSIFYFLLLDQFCLPLKEVRTLSKQHLARFGIRPVAPLDPHASPEAKQVRSGGSQRQVLANQSRVYCNGVEGRFPELFAGIKESLVQWVSRIAYACWKEGQLQRSRKEESVYYQTIDRPHRVTRSLNLRTPHSLLPALKHTIR